MPPLSLTGRGSGSSASAARGCPPTRSSRGPGGREVGGWDRVATPYLDALDGIEVEISPEPVVPDGLGGGRLVRLPGGARAARGPSFSRELVELRRSIVVAGTHGKGTTAAMIAFALRETRRRSGLADRRARARSSGATRARGRAGSSSRATSPTARSSGCRREIAVVTNVELDHHSEFRSLGGARGGVRPLDRDGAARRSRRAAVRGHAGAPRRAQPPERGRRPRGARARRRRARRRPRLRSAGSPGTGRRFEVSRGRRRDDRRRLRAPSGRDRGHDRRRARGIPGAPAARALPASPRLADAPPRAPSSARRSPRPTTSSSPMSISPARQPDPAVTGKLVVDALSDRGRLAAWMPDVDDAACVPRAARGAGRRAARPRRRRASTRARAPPRAAREARVIAHRGGRRALAPHDDRHRRAGALPRAAGDARRARRAARLGRRPRASRSRRSGSARTCSSHDDGRRRARAQARGRARRGARSRASCSSPAAARRTPSASIARATPASAGFEFASAIPGTAGGGVRMNAGAYGSDWRAVLVDARRRRRARARARSRPTSSSSSYRHSGARARRGRRAGALPARRRGPSRRSRREVAELLAQRKATQPTTKRTFGSVFKNPTTGPGAGG